MVRSTTRTRDDAKSDPKPRATSNAPSGPADIATTDPPCRGPESDSPGVPGVSRPGPVPPRPGPAMTGKKKFKSVPGAATRKIIETRALMRTLLSKPETVSQDQASGFLAALRADFKAYT